MKNFLIDKTAVYYRPFVIAGILGYPFRVRLFTLLPAAGKRLPARVSPASRPRARSVMVQRGRAAPRVCTRGLLDCLPPTCSASSSCSAMARARIQ